MSDIDRTGEENAAVVISEMDGDTPDGLSPAAYLLLYEQAYQDICEAVTDQEPSSKLPDEALFKERVFEFLDARRDDLDKAICERLKYCERKHFLGAAVQLAIIIAQALSGYWGWKLAPACWLILSGILDRFCECSKEAGVRVRRISGNV